MLDDLRNSSSYVEDEEEEEKQPEAAAIRRPAARRRRQQEKTFMGLNAQQRFLISLILFLMVCFLGLVALLLSGSISLF